MSDDDRDRLRALQDRWLDLPAVRLEIRNFGDDALIAGPLSPSFRQVREVVLPDWEEWFADFFT